MVQSAKFFDSVAGDRTYNAQAMADVFDQIETEGVTALLVDPLKVIPRAPTQMGIRVNPGAAWVRGRLFESDANVDLALDAAHATLARIDRIVIRQDLTARTMVLTYVAGVAAASPAAPALTNTAQVYDFAVAQVAVAAAATTIDTAQITDQRVTSTPVGAFATPFAALQTFNAGIALADAQNIAVGSTTGGKIGTATTQKIGFWNKTPIVQPTDANTQGGFGDIIQGLINSGIIGGTKSNWFLNQPNSGMLGGTWQAYAGSGQTVSYGSDTISISSQVAGLKFGSATTTKLGWWNATPVVQGTVTGSRGGNAALASLLTLLATYGLIVNSSTA